MKFRLSVAYLLSDECGSVCSYLDLFTFFVGNFIVSFYTNETKRRKNAFKVQFHI